MEHIKSYAPVLLRYSMALVFIWFGVQQFIDTSHWLAFVPDSVVSMTGLSAQTLVYANATFEIIFGIMLLIGWQIRIAGVLLALHLFEIAYAVGYGEIAVRDIGLALATLSVAMHGKDELSID